MSGVNVTKTPRQIIAESGVYGWVRFVIFFLLAR
jgi:hypothetical protein